MGCSNCGTKDGKPGGCQSHGSCGTGSCNRMNVYDWLSNLPIHDPAAECRVMEVSFSQGSRKDFFRNTTTQIFEKAGEKSYYTTTQLDVSEVNRGTNWQPATPLQFQTLAR